VVFPVIGGWLVFPDAVVHPCADSPSDVVVLDDAPGLQGGGGDLDGGVLGVEVIEVIEVIEGPLEVRWLRTAMKPTRPTGLLPPHHDLIIRRAGR
jgi:hypothetical protein